MDANKQPRPLTARAVLNRYKEEELPEFLGITLKDVNQPGNSGDQPLHVATIRGDMDEITALIAAGADVNARGDLGNTPLHGAVAQGHIEAVKLLLENGASPNEKKEFGESVIEVANSHANTEIARLVGSFQR